MLARRLGCELDPEHQPNETKHPDGNEGNPPAERDAQQSHDWTRDRSAQRRAAIGKSHRTGGLAVRKPVVDDLVDGGRKWAFTDSETNPDRQQRHESGCRRRQRAKRRPDGHCEGEDALAAETVGGPATNEIKNSIAKKET